jgi:hypothetical protein
VLVPGGVSSHDAPIGITMDEGRTMYVCWSLRARIHLQVLVHARHESKSSMVRLRSEEEAKMMMRVKNRHS